MFDRLKLVSYLIKFGYLAASHFEDLASIHRAIVDFLHFHGLTEADNIDSVLERLLNTTRCGCSDRQSLASGQCKWDASQVPVKIWLTDLPGLSRADWLKVFGDATAAWESVCGIQFALADTQAEANIVVVDARIDGPSNVLADMELPCGVQRSRPLRFRADREAWSIGPGVPGRIPATTVATHELGHAIGMEHIGVNQGVALLNPMLNPNVNAPTPVDIAVVRAIYGPPKVTPPSTPPAPPTIPPSTPTVPAPGEAVLRIAAGNSKITYEGPVERLVVPGYRLTKSA